MKHKESQIEHFVNKIKKEQPENKIKIIMGNNGSGKTRNLISRYSETTENKVYLSEDYPILLKKFMNAIEQGGLLTEIKENHLTPLPAKQIKSLNMMIDKKYEEVNFAEVGIDVLQEEFSTNHIEYLLNDKNITFERFQEKSFYYIKVKDSDELEYDIFQMGTGEYLSIVYYLNMSDEERKGFFYFIDEPCNYLSPLCIDSFVKLMIESMAVRRQQFIFTTNAHEIIDRLVSYNPEMEMYLLEYQSEELITYETYRNHYSERYNILPLNNSRKSMIKLFVEDKLAKEYIQYIIPKELTKFVEIVYVNDGESELTKILKSISLLEEYDLVSDEWKPLIIYDGDQKREKDPLDEEISLYLPFPNVEEAFQEIIEKGSSLIEQGKYITAKRIFRTKDIHDAYYAVQKLLEFNSDEVMKLISDSYETENKHIIEKINEILINE
ncbi:AAA family ATPase [Listeria booriae]|uniref:ATP-binding protein n=1 Tax=Listeria booriae TaxID=1552123 RepID=A0A842F068_9LIST|nr:AAA family ATPase [Listeria booriae]MBC2242334.1 ATP-binding protein [Listeria booriae]